MPEDFVQEEVVEETASVTDDSNVTEFDNSVAEAVEIDDSPDAEVEETEEDTTDEQEEYAVEDNSEDEDSTEDVSDYTELNAELETLRAEVEELREFKHQVELKDKQALIDKYYMLDDADKARFVENIDTYSLDELNSQLALLYVEKNVDFSLENESKEEEKTPVTTFELEDDTAGATPPWVEALRRTVHE